MANFMMARINVKDFAEWKVGYDAHKHARDDAGMNEKYLFQDVDDANKITMLFEADDLEKAKGFSTSDDLIEEMQKSGVVGEPKMYFLKA